MPNTEQYEKLDLATVGQRIYIHKWYIILTAIIVASASAVPIMLLRDTYTSTAKIKIESSKTPALTGLGALVTGASSSAETEATIMTSRTVLSTAIQDANLTIVTEPAPRTLKDILDNVLRRRAKIAHPNTEQPELMVKDVFIDNQFLDKDIIITSKGNGEFSLEDPNGTISTGKINEPTQSTPGISIDVTRIPGTPGRKFVLRKESDLAALSRMQDNTTAKEIGKTGIVELTYTGKTSQQVATSLKAIVNSYTRLDSDFAVVVAQQTLDYAEQQIAPIMQSITAAEDELTEFRKKSGTVSVESEAQYLLTQIQELEQKLRQDQRPEERRRLQDAQAEFNRRLEALPDTQQRIFNLTKRIEVAQEVYLELIKKVEEARARRIAAKGNTRIIDSPNYPITPQGPRRLRLIALMALASISIYVAILAFTAPSTRKR